MVFQLDTRLIFPPVKHSEPDGLLAYGGDLSPDRLLLAYSTGIFPWFNKESEILWWSPDPRFVLFPKKVYYSRSMKKILKNGDFTIKVDTAFNRVIRECAQMPRFGQLGTWITENMIQAYSTLHDLGFAHSFEAWQDDKLVGGLYGISLGRVFFGESMFSKVSNASKAAFLSMNAFLINQEFSLIDSQVHTTHMESLGAEMISRKEYIDHVQLSQEEHETIAEKWTELYSSVTSSSSILELLT